MAILLVLACGGEGDVHHLPPEIVGMTSDLAPIYDDGQTQLYEVRLPFALPVLRPSDAQRQALRQNAPAPFRRYPWVSASQLRVQVTWTLVNLGRRDRDVEILIDPWNEFGRYYPGLTIVDEQNGEALPNLSGINIRRRLPGLGNEEGRSSRVHGTFTFADMDEVAADFATVINIIDGQVVPVDGDDGDPRIGLVNHTFHVDNRQGRTPLTDRYRPAVVPGLTGFDVGLRTTETSNIALEFAVELVDTDGDRIRPDDSDDPLLQPPNQYYTLGSG
jgi:hypothetical protein